jgi:hypothetical protein
MFGVIAGSGAALAVKDCGLTERRLYVKIVNERLMGEVKVGSVVQAGILISNSEVGCGSVNLSSLIWELAYANGLIREKMIRKYHVGRRGLNSEMFDGEEYEHLLSNKALQARDNSFWMQVHDVAKHLLTDVALFENQMATFRGAAENKATRPIPEVIEVSQKRFKWSENDAKNILDVFSRNGDFTQWGLSSAVTNYAQRSKNYDTRIDWERSANDIIDLTDSQWHEIAQ